MTENNLNIYILPVSGGSFCVQLGQIAAVSLAYSILKAKGKNVSRKREKPDIALASSGGNIAAYFSLASDWNRDRILANAHLIRSESFMTGWAEYVPSWLFLPIARSVFRPGYGFNTLFDRCFTTKSASYGTEIWTGVMNKTKKQHQLFNNKKEGNTILVPDKIKGDEGTLLFTGNNLDPVYLDGDRKKIAEVTMASASIPWLVKPVPINGDACSDGGSMFSSPLSVVSRQIANLSDCCGGTYKLRMIYFATSLITQRTVLTIELMSEITNLIQAAFSSDIQAFLNIMKLFGADVNNPDHHSDLDPDALSRIIDQLDESGKNYGILLYPGSNNYRLDITNIDPELLIEYICQTEKNLRAFVWLGSS